MVGADLANLANEAALLAARRNHEQVDESDFTDALERIVLGAERQVLMSAEDRRRTAYHEGGHAIVGMLTPGADPVRKVSIIPRGMALGVTFSAPESDRFNYREPEVLAKIKVALGGRAAEEIVFGETSTGAESDIQQLTEIARQMVGRWGMSPAIGPVAVVPARRRRAAPARRRGDLRPTRSGSSTRRCVASSRSPHAQVLSLLRENRPKLDSLAKALLEHETLDEDDAYAAAGVPHADADGAEPFATAARLGGELTRTGQAPAVARGNALAWPPTNSTAQLDLFRRRRDLRHALATVEAAIAQHARGKPGYGEARGLAEGSARRARAHRAPARPTLKRRRRPLWTMTAAERRLRHSDPCPGSGRWTLMSSTRSRRSTSLPT